MEKRTIKHKTQTAINLIMATALLGACAEGSGSISVLLEAEDVILEGLKAGDGAENIGDGWDVNFEKYLVTIGDIDVKLTGDDHDDHDDHGDHDDHDDHDDHGARSKAEASDVYVADLAKVPAAGLSLWQLDNLAEGRWSFEYKTAGAGDGSTRHDSVMTADYDSMVSNDWTYMVDGTITKSDGQSCPPASLTSTGTKMANGNKSGDNDCYDAPSIRFTFGATAETKFGPCEIDEQPGFAITADNTQTVAATIHGDHLFFNGFPEGDEGGITRLAQWLADCDLNLDGTVTKEELQMIAPSQLPAIDTRYQLGGSPITPLNNMYDYVSAQFKTQGHFQGEGECPVDGVGHKH